MLCFNFAKFTKQFGITQALYSKQFPIMYSRAKCYTKCSSYSKITKKLIATQYQHSFCTKKCFVTQNCWTKSFHDCILSTFLSYVITNHWHITRVGFEPTTFANLEPMSYQLDYRDFIRGYHN